MKGEGPIISFFRCCEDASLIIWRGVPCERCSKRRTHCGDCGGRRDRRGRSAALWATRNVPWEAMKECGSGTLRVCLFASLPRCLSGLVPFSRLSWGLGHGGVIEIHGRGTCVSCWADSLVSSGPGFWKRKGWPCGSVSPLLDSDKGTSLYVYGLEKNSLPSWDFGTA